MDIHQSIDEILESEDILGKTFYEIFLNDFPEVQQYFQNVNLGRQAVVLAVALLLIEQYDTYRYPAIANYLRELGQRHRERNIPPETYPRFRDAVLAALARHHGASWNDHVRRQWAEAIDRAAAVMLEAYGSRSDGLPE